MLLEPITQLALRDQPLAMRVSSYTTAPDVEAIESRVSALLEIMSLPEKIGQMTQLDASEGNPPDYLGERLRAGLVGSVLNQVDVHTTCTWASGLTSRTPSVKALMPRSTSGIGKAAT